MIIETNTLFANFRPHGLYRAKKNDNNDNLCKLHVGIYKYFRAVSFVGLARKQCKGQHGLNIDCLCYRFLFARQMLRG